MATQTFTRLVDDLDGKDADRTVRFSIDNDAYEIDLSTEHEVELRSALAPWVNVARKVPAARRAGRTATRATTPKQDLDAIRAWAKDNGHEVADRGRIPVAVVDAYRARDTSAPAAKAPARKAATKATTRKAPAKKTAARKPAKKTTARKAAASPVSTG